ncbi:MmgE/PrpD family protein [Ferrovibrio terrae]|uniref:MmgE/PrpD family protein n=1 Tax=Ferrovibrio terrae TaxID=2594003 RepID=A0A516H183_9PROT|nr:MmgE/PrpD family protein [Ferrovibrio terrae]QDO97549.1 MmgE/PrpD family protein [Ferrovibrio terrae]
MTQHSPIRTQSQRPPTQDLAEFTAALCFEDIPAPVLDRAKLLILDSLGVGLASNAYPFADRVVAGVAVHGEAGTCRLIGRRERLPVRDAALANGVLMHGLDFDDTHLNSIVHTTATSLPCALSFAEQLGLHGRDLLTAYAAGGEAAIRIGLAIDGGFHHVGFHATGVISHFSSAIVAAKLLGLDAAQTMMAQGIAGSTASGIQVFLEEGAWTKRLHPGWGAVAGITAARLAQHGFVAPSRPLEGKFGLIETHLQAHAGGAKPEAVAAGLGKTWHLADTAIKPYPVCHFIHGCADAAIELHRDLAGEEIEAVEALLPQPTLHIVAEPAAQKERPTTDYEAKFSTQFVVAACLLKGGFGLPDLQPAALADPQVLALSARVRCAIDPDTAFPTYFSGGVKVTTRSGRQLSRHVRVNSGAGDRALQRDEVIRKFMASASLTVSRQKADDICNAALTLETISVDRLMSALSLAD